MAKRGDVVVVSEWQGRWARVAIAAGVDDRGRVTRVREGSRSRELQPWLRCWSIDAENIDVSAASALTPRIFAGAQQAFTALQPHCAFPPEMRTEMRRGV